MTSYGGPTSRHSPSSPTEGILEKKESKHEDMIAILEEYQKYVPHGKKIPSEGDGLSNMRGVESQDARADEATAADTLEGLELVTIEWHARVAALETPVSIPVHTGPRGEIPVSIPVHAIINQRKGRF
uniref:Uncharacterized protein n=1 Tax=Branchiostoma floridae TaxID=7739 RepID=C3Y8P9_BRAFL|eukprot:XP_002607476.1 hypothetical protein BRAFLDRAFT_69908 [Branchiostoma floridae]